MNENKRIEKANAERFLQLYNDHYDTTFKIEGISDAPDIRCKDSDGNVINIEVTLIQDQDKDIQALLGRSDHKSIEALKEYNQRVAEGKEEPKPNRLLGNICETAAMYINKKLLMRYGPNTALVARDSSGFDWKWDKMTDELKSKLKLDLNSYDKGIWILNFSKTKLYKIV